MGDDTEGLSLLVGGVHSLGSIGLCVYAKITNGLAKEVNDDGISQ